MNGKYVEGKEELSKVMKMVANAMRGPKGNQAETA